MESTPFSLLDFIFPKVANNIRIIPMRAPIAAPIPGSFKLPMAEPKIIPMDSSILIHNELINTSCMLSRDTVFGKYAFYDNLIETTHRLLKLL
jgi:hypothetical protein